MGQSLRDVIVGDELLMVWGRASVPVVVTAAETLTLVAGGRIWSRETGALVAGPDPEGRPVRLVTREAHYREMAYWELGRYLSALVAAADRSPSLDERLEHLTQEALIRANHAAQRLCALLGIAP